MRERTKINYAAMSEETKICIQNTAKILYSNGVNIQRYDKTSAITQKIKNKNVNNFCIFCMVVWNMVYIFASLND